MDAYCDISLPTRHFYIDDLLNFLFDGTCWLLSWRVEKSGKHFYFFSRSPSVENDPSDGITYSKNDPESFSQKTLKHASLLLRLHSFERTSSPVSDGLAVVAEYGRIGSAVGQASSSLNLTESRAAVYGLDLTVRREDSDALLLSAFRKVVKWVILTSQHLERREEFCRSQVTMKPAWPMRSRGVR